MRHVGGLIGEFIHRCSTSVSRVAAFVSVVPRLAGACLLIRPVGLMRRHTKA
ncbi:hypothetical protein GTV32_22475 [Gordonia sp. SID5947]|uniref:hypothetical protein n=1 Tax=Gordonia sp. SID5947 TaxID=2690315 RepID=UPI00136F430D|nr:hypothetical protein [Gordonia sp. SID5947]MYR08907.1 hypothetical protein [Gordonia sp. SID5947]